MQNISTISEIDGVACVVGQTLWMDATNLTTSVTVSIIEEIMTSYVSLCVDDAMPISTLALELIERN